MSAYVMARIAAPVCFPQTFEFFHANKLFSLQHYVDMWVIDIIKFTYWQFSLLSD